MIPRVIAAHLVMYYKMASAFQNLQFTMAHQKVYHIALITLRETPNFNFLVLLHLTDSLTKEAKMIKLNLKSHAGQEELKRICNQVNGPITKMQEAHRSIQ